MLKLNQKGFTGFEAVIIIVALLAVGSAGYFAYQARQDKTDYSVSTVKNQKDSNKQNPEAPVKAVSDDEQVIAAAKAYCEAEVDDKGNSYVFTLGTTGPKSVKVAYPPGKQFATVNSGCAPKGGHSAAAYVLKKVNNQWLVLYRSQMEDPEMTKKYGIPPSSEFYK